MNIKQKIVIETKSFQTTYCLETLADTHATYDSPKDRRLIVELMEARPQQSIVISGDEYDSLGQWTDDSLNDYLIDLLKLEKEEKIGKDPIKIDPIAEDPGLSATDYKGEQIDLGTQVTKTVATVGDTSPTANPSL